MCRKGAGEETGPRVALSPGATRAAPANNSGRPPSTTSFPSPSPVYSAGQSSRGAGGGGALFLGVGRPLASRGARGGGLGDGLRGRLSAPSTALLDAVGGVRGAVAAMGAGGGCWGSATQARSGPARARSGPGRPARAPCWVMVAGAVRRAAWLCWWLPLGSLLERSVLQEVVGLVCGCGGVEELMPKPWCSVVVWWRCCGARWGW